MTFSVFLKELNNPGLASWTVEAILEHAELISQMNELQEESDLRLFSIDMEDRDKVERDINELSEAATILGKRIRDYIRRK